MVNLVKKESVIKPPNMVSKFEKHRIITERLSLPRDFALVSDEEITCMQVYFVSLTYMENPDMMKMNEAEGIIKNNCFDSRCRYALVLNY